jgi:geranylgeranyl diphosphate synthase type I|tara:strand:- start:445 stop:1413 length:969 start_codon:yes stop_codon:yes gene_type:complete
MKKNKIEYSEYLMPPEAEIFLDIVKKEFSESLNVEGKHLSKWLKHHGESEGKWIRAKLGLATGSLLGLSSDTYIKWAVVCELIHSASLLHDDICDKDSLRRGRITVWKEFGIPAAICTGDYLIAESFRKITEISQGWHQTILLKLLSCSVKDIVFGQSVDVSIDSISLTWENYKKIAIKKTGPLILMPMMGMFKCKEFDGDESTALNEISEDFGLAYQWVNDIENIIGSDQESISDIIYGHPNAIIINFLETRSKAERKKYNDIKELGMALSNYDFEKEIEDIKLFLTDSMSQIHRLPLVIQPILLNIKEEMLSRVGKYGKN